MVEKIEMIGIDIKDLDQEIETRRFKLKTKLMNEHLVNESVYNRREFIRLHTTDTGVVCLVFTKSATDLIGYLLIGFFTGSL
jgi:hypothetical protein